MSVGWKKMAPVFVGALANPISIATNSTNGSVRVSALSAPALPTALSSSASASGFISGNTALPGTERGQSLALSVGSIPSEASFTNKASTDHDGPSELTIDLAPTSDDAPGDVNNKEGFSAVDAASMSANAPPTDADPLTTVSGSHAVAVPESKDGWVRENCAYCQNGIMVCESEDRDGRNRDTNEQSGNKTALWKRAKKHPKAGKGSESEHPHLLLGLKLVCGTFVVWACFSCVAQYCVTLNEKKKRAKTAAAANRAGRS
ncbi:hypothetical protein QFC21_003368 [Naganishia friedmannii]|uniref:Uncharacterized protein n=1 Tax=Naganishia friedmannii TaxID=89922 RepID=A0ACC2VQ05_9TREE|nr:hypothetical protein QFC21_003368 [Naganishia friedmannii]